MSLLIAYGTIEGHSGKIARHVEALARDMGKDVTLFDTGDKRATINVAEFDKAILVASVHERRHPQPFEIFLLAQRAQLEQVRTMMLSVSLSAAFADGMEEAQDYLDEMKMRAQFEPDAELLVAGAVNTRKYDFYATQVLKHVVLRGRNYDPAVQEHELTDWDALSAEVTAFLEGH